MIKRAPGVFVCGIIDELAKIGGRRKVISKYARRFLSLVECLLIIVAFAVVTVAKHKDDLVVMKNGDRMTGEIKKMQRGQLTFKADYMAADVVLDWSKVARLESKDPYLISMTDGHQIAEHFKLVAAKAVEHFQIGPGGSLKVNQGDVLRILPIESKFLKQL